MKYDFLYFQHKRMEIVSAFAFLQSKVQSKKIFKDYGFTDDEALGLAFEVLSFIMYKSFSDKTCSERDVVDYLFEIINKKEDKHILKDDCGELASYIIRDCLRNGGNPYFFKTYNYKDAKEVEFPIRLITDKMMGSGDDRFISYSLTDLGYKLMFLTHEVEESTQIDFELMRVKLSIEKGNFEDAKTRTDNIFTLSMSQKEKIENEIKRIRSDVRQVPISEYEEIYKRTFDVGESQFKDAKSILESVSDILSSGKYDKQKFEDVEHRRKIDDIEYIKKRLSQIVDEQLDLFRKRQNLEDVYSAEIGKMMSFTVEDKFDINEIILNPLRSDPTLVCELPKIMRPLFKPQIRKMLNINKIFAPQEIIEDEDSDEDDEKTSDNILPEMDMMDENRIRERKRIQKLNDQYVGIFEVIIERAMQSESGEVTLQEIVDSLIPEEKKIFVSSIDVLRMVLLNIHKAGFLDFLKIKSRENIILDPKEFDVGLLVTRLLEKNENTKKVSMFRVSRGEGSVLIKEFEDDFANEEEADFEASVVSCAKVLECTNLKFKVEVS